FHIRATGLLMALAVFLGFAILPCSAASTQQTPGWELALFVEANKDYSLGRYEQAIEKYNVLAQSPLAGPSVFYNLGNAHMRADNLGMAIANYKKAKILAPRDKDIDFNLRFAKNLRIDAQEEDEFSFFGWLSIFTPTELFWVFALANALFFAALALHLRFKREWTYYLFIVLALVFVFSGLFCAARLYLAKTDNRAVIVAQKAHVRAGPHERDTLLFELNPGSLVRVERKENGWRFIRFTSAKRGWVKSSDILPVMPLHGEQPSPVNTEPPITGGRKNNNR
ncbi:MAG: SH3 domain-containing protein, partial [Desulfatibacillaceae bacterium]|nr:SH3 domain-containing protein [Desulfatibacillaceae bacterium]